MLTETIWNWKKVIYWKLINENQTLILKWASIELFKKTCENDINKKDGTPQLIFWSGIQGIFELF